MGQGLNSKYSGDGKQIIDDDGTVLGTFSKSGLTLAAGAAVTVDDSTITGTDPVIQLTNTTAEDTDGGRPGLITFKGTQSGGEVTTLVKIQASHDGALDDQKGDLIFLTNDGTDADTPTEAVRINSAQATSFSGLATASANLTVNNGAATPVLQLTKVALEDTDGGRDSTIVFKGIQSGGEFTTLAKIQGSHDGAVDDEKGDLIFYTNDGADSDTPTEAFRLDSAQLGAFSADLRVSGLIGTGGAASTDTLIKVASACTGGTNQKGIEISGAIGNSDGDGNNLWIFQSNATLADDHFNVVHFRQAQASNSGSHGGREVGFLAGGKMSGGSVFAYACFTDNTGFNSDHFLHQSGTNSSVLGGKLTASGGLVTKVSIADMTAPPTDAELDAAFGAPATVGNGFIGLVNDNDTDTVSYIVWAVGDVWFTAAGTLAT